MRQPEELRHPANRVPSDEIRYRVVISAGPMSERRSNPLGQELTNCTFDTGDDCVAVNSGRNGHGRRVNAPAENIVIQNCRMKGGHGGSTMGSQCTGGIRNIFAQDCQLDSPQRDMGR